MLENENRTPGHKIFLSDLKAGDTIYPICTRVPESGSVFYGKTLKAPSLEVAIKGNGFEIPAEGYMYECIVTHVPDPLNSDFTANVIRNCGRASVVTEKNHTGHAGHAAKTGYFQKKETKEAATEAKEGKETLRKDPHPAHPASAYSVPYMTNCLFYHEVSVMGKTEPYCDMEMNMRYCGRCCGHFKNIFPERSRK